MLPHLLLDRFGANIVVVPHSNTLALDYGGVSVSGVPFDVHELTNEDAARILEIPYRKRLSVIAPKLLSVTEIEGRQVVLAGVDFASELRLKRWWRINGQKPAAEDDLLAGYEAARTLGLIQPAPSGAPTAKTPAHHGSDDSGNLSISRDRLQLAGREHRVSGVLAQTGGPEDRMIFGSLRHVQETAGKQGRLSVIEVSALCKDCPVSDIVAQIRQKLPHAKVSAVQQAVRARNDTVERLTKFAGAISAVVLIIGGLMIFTTMMSAVVERTKEIGVLRAIGFRRVHIIKGLMMEAAAREKRDRALALLDRVGLATKAARLPNQLSGGEQGRLAIARALVNDPPLLLADEPTGTLDTVTGDEIMRVFFDLKEQGQTIFMVTHNPDNAALADRTIPIRDGRLVN